MESQAELNRKSKIVGFVLVVALTALMAWTLGLIAGGQRVGNELVLQETRHSYREQELKRQIEHLSKVTRTKDGDYSRCDEALSATLVELYKEQRN